MLGRLYCPLTLGQLIIFLKLTTLMSCLEIHVHCTHLSVTHIDIVIFIMGPVGSKEECFEKTLKIRLMMLNKGEKEEN